MPRKAFVVYPRTKQQAREGLVIKGKRKKFTGGSMMNLWADDAAEVKEAYGRDKVHVVEDDQLGRALNGERWSVSDNNEVKTLHKYTFSGVAVVGKQEWYIWRDGTRHRFKEKVKRANNS